ncbi:MAG: hypothetical protein HY286_02000 [Planctomycetes bacterium]|nr:hypothetical protein [Planctomycetota bacterium]
METEPLPQEPRKDAPLGKAGSREWLVGWAKAIPSGIVSAAIYEIGKSIMGDLGLSWKSQFWEMMYATTITFFFGVLVWREIQRWKRWKRECREFNEVYEKRVDATLKVHWKREAASPAENALEDFSKLLDMLQEASKNIDYVESEKINEWLMVADTVLRLCLFPGQVELKTKEFRDAVMSTVKSAPKSSGTFLIPLIGSRFSDAVVTPLDSLRKQSRATPTVLKLRHFRLAIS